MRLICEAAESREHCIIVPPLFPGLGDFLTDLLPVIPHCTIKQGLATGVLRNQASNLRAECFKIQIKQVRIDGSTDLSVSKQRRWEDGSAEKLGRGEGVCHPDQPGCDVMELVL